MAGFSTVISLISLKFTRGCLPCGDENDDGAAGTASTLSSRSVGRGFDPNVITIDGQLRKSTMDNFNGSGAT